MCPDRPPERGGGYRPFRTVSTLPFGEGGSGHSSGRAMPGKVRFTNGKSHFSGVSGESPKGRGGITLYQVWECRRIRTRV